MSVEPLDAARAALAGERAWLVGGALRDRLLGRDEPRLDLDIAVDADVGAAARRLARAAGAAPFPLSDLFGGWRVVGPDQAWQVDLTPLMGGALDIDLAARDLTVNAIAEPLGGGALVDPHGGLQDLRQRRLRMVGSGAFAADPLRTMRVARLACRLGFTVEAQTAAAVRRHAAELRDVAGERIFAELRAVVTADAAPAGLALMDELGLTAVVLPELERLRGVGQNPYHHRDVHGHTLEVLDAVMALERDPAPIVGDALAAGVSALLAEPLADELTRAGALRFGALLHDAAKPLTRVELPGGGVGFPGHDSEGAAVTRAALERLRTSERLRAHVAALARHHLRLGFLVHDAPLARRTMYRYLMACAPVAADVTLLSIADRLATRGRKADQAIARHLALGRDVLGEALTQRAAGPPVPLVRGDALAEALAVAPGPRLGELLAAIAEARYAGEVTTAAEAIDFARRWQATAPQASAPAE